MEAGHMATEKVADQPRKPEARTQVVHQCTKVEADCSLAERRADMDRQVDRTASRKARRGWLHKPAESVDGKPVLRRREAAKLASVVGNLVGFEAAYKQVATADQPDMAAVLVESRVAPAG
jgi:hypothetical protein